MGENANSLLVVDDDALVRKTYQILFEQAGYSVAVCNNGNTATAYLQNHAVDAVLLDIFMPEREGIETLLDIKKLFPRVRVIVMTGGGASARHDFLAIAKKFGADGVVRKPVAVQEIIAMLKLDEHKSITGQQVAGDDRNY